MNEAVSIVATQSQRDGWGLALLVLALALWTASINREIRGLLDR